MSHISLLGLSPCGALRLLMIPSLSLWGSVTLCSKWSPPIGHAFSPSEVWACRTRPDDSGGGVTRGFNHRSKRWEALCTIVSLADALDRRSSLRRFWGSKALPKCHRVPVFGGTIADFLPMPSFGPDFYGRV